VIVYSVVNELPEIEPVTLEEVKGHLEYYGTLKDSYIQGLITTARRLCEGYAGLSLVTQERSIKIDRFPCSRYENGWKRFIEIPYGPVQYVESFSYENEDGTTTTLVLNTDYKIDTHNKLARIYPIENGEFDSWPSDAKDILNPITITYVAGYDDVSGIPVPAEAKTAIMRLVARMFEDRGDSNNRWMIDEATEDLLNMIRVTWNADAY
jgi:uncharacterized phiE125 gp8 family phage protein